MLFLSLIDLGKKNQSAKNNSKQQQDRYDLLIIKIILIWAYFITWFDLVHEQGSADRLATQRVLVHGIIDVLDQPVAYLNVLAADGRDRLSVHVRLLVRLVVIIIMITEPWQESAHDGPTSEQLRINYLTLL